MIALKMQEIVGYIQQILECQVVCFLPGCLDSGLRHPLLDLLPEVSASQACAGNAGDICQEERARALCDLAMQTGQMQMLRERQGPRSLAALPLESSGGVLGALLLGGEQAEQFGAGEQRLLYACLSMYLPDLEQALWEQSRLALRSRFEQGLEERAGEAWLYAAPGQFVRSEFVSMVGHELRAPLSVIRGYAALLHAYGGPGDQRLAPEQQRRYLEAIGEQSGLLELLVNDLLDIARLQRGDLALRLRAVDVEALCRRVVQFGRARAEQRAPGKYRLECRFVAPLVPAWADAERLQQILTNLLENSIKYSPEGGLIELAASFSGGQVIITVRDQGLGIPARYTADLFQPFKRLERSATTHIAGMGLGLYISRKLVEAMHGDIDLQSCEGSGTSVTIRLPTVGLGERFATDAMVPAPSL